MTEEEKQLLWMDLCARLPYNVLVHIHDIDVCDYDNYLCEDYLAKFRINSIQIKPYLRLMSSITEEEKEEIKPLFSEFTDEFGKRVLVVRQNKMALYQDWLNAHYFDYRDLIGKELALEAPKDMYKL